jgi:hypothetical protein
MADLKSKTLLDGSSFAPSREMPSFRPSTNAVAVFLAPAMRAPLLLLLVALASQCLYFFVHHQVHQF